ncbi:MAG: NEAT domain-containing protein [Firmicutes bacterium]|nr:NEAT domain-containing protein [Bacillota bacterium]
MKKHLKQGISLLLAASLTTACIQTTALAEIIQYDVLSESYELGNSINAMSSPGFEANKSYNLKAELRNANETGSRSMAGDVLIEDVRAKVDKDGNVKLTLNFRATTIMNIPCYATGFYLANKDGESLSGSRNETTGEVTITDGKEYTEADFVLDSDNNAVATITLPYIAEDGYYQGFINSSFMAASVALWLDYDSIQENNDFSGYVLMNIPYSEFYNSEKADIGDVDAVSSATNKVGNYGKAGGAYHNGTTAAKDESGAWIAVGGDNGAKVKGVTWAVKASSIDEIKALGGEEVTDDSKITVATAAHGTVSQTALAGYQTLTETPAYSYYVLENAPENYLVLENGKFVGGNDVAESNEINVTVSYGTNWGDIQLAVSEAENVSDKLINAVVLTADDGTSKGLYHLGQVWSFKDIAWKVAVTEGLDGKTIKNIRYYCTVKDSDITDETVPEYKNYIYDYNVNIEVPQVYTGEVKADFKDANTIELSGLPDDAQELKAKVYYTTGGRNAVYTYLTPVVTDPADDDNDPVFANVENGKIVIAAGSTTNKAGTTVEYGVPVDGTTYTIELSSGNYIINKITAEYKEKESLKDGNYIADIEFLKIDSDDTSSAGRSFVLSEVPVAVSNGKYTVRLMPTGSSASMIEKIEQETDGTYTELPFIESESGKYVEATLNSIDDIQKIQFTINTGTSYGVMVNQARLKFVEDTVKEDKSSESSSESTTEDNSGISEETTAQSPAKAEKAADDTIRFAAGIDSLNYKEVGFIFEADGKEVKRSTKIVYSSIADSKLATSDFNSAKYLYSFEISDIADLSKNIKVTPYYVDLKGNEVKAESSVYSLNDLSGDVMLNTLADDSASGSAVKADTAERKKEDTASENEVKEIAKEEAVLNDIETVNAEEVLD